jgi:hypothetical protein
MVDARSGGQQILDRRLLLPWRQAADVVDPQRGKRLVQTNRSIRNVLAEKNCEHALANRREVTHSLHVAVLHQGAATGHGHEGCRRELLQSSTDGVEVGLRPARCLWRRNRLPLGNWVNGAARRVRCGIRARAPARETGRRDGPDDEGDHPGVKTNAAAFRKFTP